MDSSTRLDYVLFQLTPTRTRCDLVVFSGGKNEKLASGLLEPFIAHLRSAKDQIPKGGYSITLRAPSKHNASWFTKGTLERFVRFVSTPEVLERFVTIEKEIVQIESSVQSNELSHTTEEDADNKKSIVPYKPKSESNGANGPVQEENSKHRLQRVLETRKAVLRKEQAMAYARAFVAGFDMDCINDLLAFADAFGASRLREACINFKELCNKKHGDGLWMDELAAMEAYVQPDLAYVGTSGIVLTTENTAPTQSILQNFQNGVQLQHGDSADVSVSESNASHASSDANQGQAPPTTANAQFPMSWPNHFPQFMYNYQNPSMHQMPPYQGYPYPGMPIPPHFQGSMQWPPNAEEYSDSLREVNRRRSGKSSSRRKEKSSNKKESQNSDHDAHSEPSDSNSESDVDAYLEQDGKDTSPEKPHKRRNGKKGSRMVVIRNINYITSKKKDGATDESSLDEDELMDDDTFKQGLEDAVGSMEKHHKSTSRHHKTVKGKKRHSVANKSNGDVNQDLENDPAEDLSEGVKTNENWGAFQNLLLKDDDSGSDEIAKQKTLDVQDEYFTIQGSASGSNFHASHVVDLETEKGTKQRMVATDDFVVTRREEVHEGSNHMDNFDNGEMRPTVKKRDNIGEELFLSQRAEEARSAVHDALPDCNGLSVTKTQKGEDWFTIKEPERSVGTNAVNESSIFNDDPALMFGGDHVQTEKNRKDDFVDNSFMVQSRGTDDLPTSQWRTDLSMISDLTLDSQHESGTADHSRDKYKPSVSYEPDDLCMVLVRDSGLEPAASWSPELDYEMDMSFKESDRRHSEVDTVGLTEDKPATNGNPEKKLSGKEGRSKPLRGSLSKSKTEIISRSRKPSTPSRVVAPKSKAEREEENRKKLEELAIQRLKRIAERSAASGFTPAKKSPVESKKGTSLKDDKKIARSSTQDTKRSSLQKPSITGSTTDRLVPVKHKETPSPPLKSTPPKKTSVKANGVVTTTSSPRTSKEENKKSGLNQLKPSQKLNGDVSSSPDVQETKRTDSPEIILQKEPDTPIEAEPLDVHDTLEEKNVCEPVSSIVKVEQIDISNVDSVDKSLSVATIDPREVPLPVNGHSAKLDSFEFEANNRGVSIASSVSCEENDTGNASQVIESISQIKMDSLPAEHESVLSTTTGKSEDIATTNGNVLVSSEILEEETIHYPVESTPPSTTEFGLESTPTRKKWNNTESSPVAAKGFKKLMFGRKKTIYTA